ncbi:MAG TPA: hypothetical protein VLT33_31650 [Labilithrix sp.]|nr:hypothetical protein [Labilithrix sp.]
MRIDKWIVALACSFLVLSTSCKPKVGGKCTIGQSYCTKEGALLCGEDGKLVATSCQGPLGCVQHGKSAACDQSLAVAGEPCEDLDNVACSVDKRSELDCKAHSWVVGATCKGAKGCELKGDELFCDHTLADKDDPCHRDGQIACTNDKAFILRCEGNVMKAIDSCRGPKSCTFEEHPAQQRIEFNCDDSVAQEGDPCESDNNHACAVDKKAIHVCKDHKFVQLKACLGPKGCTFDPNTDKLSCDQAGGGVFVGSGGAAKISSAGGAAGGTKGKAGAAGSASAKPAVSAAASAAASAKPAASASAAVAGSSSAKPGTSAAPATSGSAKPAGSAKTIGKGKLK